MSEEAEKIKKLVAFKKLEKRIGKLESELKELQTMLEAVNSILLEKGFKRVEIAKVPAPMEALPPAEYKDIIPLKTVTGELLANLYVSEDSLRIVPAENKNFDINFLDGLYRPIMRQRENR